MEQIKVYISAKLEHGPKLLALCHDGIHVNARWIETADTARKRMKPVTHWQQENFDDIQAAHFFILYAEPGDHLKGSLFEIGYAAAAGKLCWVAGDGHGIDVIPDGGSVAVRIPHRDILPWSGYRQSIRVVQSLDVAFSQILALARQESVMDGNGKLIKAPRWWDRALGRRP